MAMPQHTKNNEKYRRAVGNGGIVWFWWGRDIVETPCDVETQRATFVQAAWGGRHLCGIEKSVKSAFPIVIGAVSSVQTNKNN